MPYKALSLFVYKYSLYMVELEIEDFNVILSWFTHVFGKKNPKDIPTKDRKTFWKLNFLAEDKIKEERERLDTDPDV